MEPLKEFQEQTLISRECLERITKRIPKEISEETIEGIPRGNLKGINSENTEFLFLRESWDIPSNIPGIISEIIRERIPGQTPLEIPDGMP